ncbi:MAG: translation initiation factor IF-2, partial [Prochlorotrichaceae cyanobacterium]
MNNSKIRIYDLSKELSLENRDILSVCEQLDIPFKSHSSTISEEDAQRIRAAAKKYSGSSNGHPPNSKASTAPTSRRKAAPIKRNSQKSQQILEVRSRQNDSADSASPQTQVAESSETDTPTTSRPNRPTPPVRPARRESGNQSQSLKSPPQRPTDSASSPLTPPVAPTAPENNHQELASPPVKSPNEPNSLAVAEKEPLETSQAEPPRSEAPVEAQRPKALVAPQAPAVPALQGPPQPPTAPSASTSASSSTVSSSTVSKPKPVMTPPSRRPPGQSSDRATEAKADKPKDLKGKAKPGETRPSSGKDKPVVVKHRPHADRLSPTRENKPVKTVRSDKTSEEPKAPQVMELRRPRPIRPTEPAPVEETVSPVDEDLTDTGLGADIETEGLEKPRLRRPMDPIKLTRKKTHGEEDEEEKENNRKAAKLSPKNKRRTYILDDDDDDLDDLGNNQDLVSAEAMSLSLARPPKPKSAPQAAKPTPAPVAKRRSSGASSRDNRRRDRQAQETTRERPEILSLTSNLTLQELAEELVVPETEIIKTLFMKGIVATITQTLDFPTMQTVADEYGVVLEQEVEQAKAKKTLQVLDDSDMEHLHRRPPVVTVMGHVDHGKTSLLDAIRKTRVAQGEAGGITQHIGAYHVDVEHNGVQQQIVFLDTPGHEAFTAMRARGAKVTDLAILVVAADDGVRPQTIEALSHAKAAEVPLIVAINKVDKEEAQPDRVKQELTEYGLVPEEWGGDTIMVPVSALKGENLDTLLEMILLVSEVEELSANPDRLARGSVIEAHLDKARGPVASFLVQNGTLRIGDVLVTGSVFGKVRAMINDRGERVESAGPSIPVEVLGLSDVPAAGDEFEVFADEKEARAEADRRADNQRISRLQQSMASRRVSLGSISAQAQEGELKELNLILKADVQGSVEAILGALEQVPQKEVQLRVLLAAPGEVTETDVDLAAASGAVILGFNTTLASGSKRAADEAGVDVREYDIIYKLLEDIQGAMEGLLEPELVEEPLGQVEVRAVFSVGRGAVAGCYVQSGKATRNCQIRVHRGNEIVYTGTLGSLRRMKDDVKEVNSGYECGIGLDSFNGWQEGDIIETFRLVTKRRTLSL